MQTVIVTGSSGYIGKAVIARLAGQYDLIGFDREQAPHPPPEAECICVDLTSDESIAAAFERVRIAHGGRIASVIHLAAFFDLSGEPDPRYEEVTVRGTERLLKALQDFEVEQFIFSSTMLVHVPDRPGRPIDEDAPLDPKLPYRKSKIDTERVLAEQRGPIPVVVLRPAGAYDDLCHSAFLAQQIASIYERQLISHVYPGDVDRGQAFLHLDDLTEAIRLAVERRADLPEEITVLLGETDVMSYDERQKAIGRLIHDEDWETREIPKALAKAGAWLEDEVLDEDPFIKPWMVDITDDHYELDIGRARSALGWEPRRSLRETLPTMIAALKKDPVAWYRANKLNAARVASASAETRKQPKGKGARAKAMAGHGEEMADMHRGLLWAHYLVIGLGAWLVTSPLQFALFDADVALGLARDVTGERGLADPVLRNALVGWNDIACGVLLMVFGVLSLSRRFAWAQWGTTAVGLWLLFAPLFFWAPSAAAFANDTIIGALVIAFSVLVPMMPGMSMAGMMDPNTLPPGWTYNPSTWLQRIPIIALGLLGFLIARDLTAYQLGHVSGLWEPFFGGQAGRNGSEFIVTSDVSKAWPIADAGLGATAYMLEVLMGAMGSAKRWRTMPWMVTFFFILVVPLGGVSIFFIIIQPIMIGTYCTLCLIAAAAMLVMIPLALDEVVAMGQYMLRSVRAGRPFWRTFFQGGPDTGSGPDENPGLAAPLRTQLAAATWGVTIPWTLLASCALGAWLMFSRLIFGTEATMADSDHLIGALIITVAVTAMAEVARPLRFLNALFGIWLIAAPWLLAGVTTTGAVVNSAVVGLILIAISLPRGVRSRHHYGSWDRFVV